MALISILLAGFGVLCIIISIVIILYTRLNEKRTLQKLNDMMDSAINSTFSETTYDETCLSALESKLSRFLIISKSSQNNIEEERNRIKSLVSDISHQTKTPVSNILLYAQLLAEQDLPNQLQLLVKEITSQSEKLRFLIEALIKASRLEAGIIRVNPKSSSIAELITNCINVIYTKADEKGITLNIQCKENLKAYIDPKWTEEAIVNILDNGIKYTQKNGAIKVSAAAYEMFTRIDITDDGIGIKEEEINLIFQRFYRSSEASQYEGVGIGLYLTREILTAQGGYIKVKSAPKKGSTFSVFLPNS
jgi:signal transduction histidine kinase